MKNQVVGVMLKTGNAAQRRLARRLARGRSRGRTVDVMSEFLGKDFSASPPADATVGSDVHTDAAGGSRKRPGDKDTLGVFASTGKEERGK